MSVAKPGFIALRDWSRGVISDVAPHALPDNAVLAAKDYWLDRQGMAYSRNGWTVLGTPVAGRTGKLCMFSADFAAPNNLLWVSDNEHLYTSTGVDKGTFTGARFDCTYRVGGGKFLMIFTGDGAIYKFNGTAFATLGGAPPTGRRYCTVYKTRLVVGGHATTDPQRMYFSPTPDIEAAWDLTNAWIDADCPIKGYAPLQNMLLVFTDRQVERLIGTTPPPGTDFDHGKVADLGCVDNRSVVIWHDSAIFANWNGVYMTNGFGFRDITAISGRKRDWLRLMRSAAAVNICCGVLRNFLFVSCTTATGTEVLFWVFNMESSVLACWDFSNIRSADFTRTPVAGYEELYSVGWEGGYIQSMVEMFRMITVNKNDGDGTPVTPSMIMKPLNADFDLTAFQDGWLDYDLRDAATDNPTLSVSIATGFEPTSFSTVPESFPETTDEVPQRFTIAKETKALTVQVVQNGPSAKTELYGLRVDANPVAPDRLAGQQ